MMFKDGGTKPHWPLTSCMMFKDGGMIMTITTTIFYIAKRYTVHNQLIDKGNNTQHECEKYKPGQRDMGPWASYQTRKIAGCACAGNAGYVFPATAG